ncbi:MAG: pyridoxal phosphate-dependent aminotransferase [Bdellovibrionota bacterium]
MISLAVGEPDWDTFEVAKAEAIESINKGFTKYVSANGIEELRKAIVEDLKKDYGFDYSPEQVSVATGGKMSIFALLQVLIGKGDEVLIPAPYWVSYPDMTELADGTPVFIPSTEAAGFKITPKDLESKITPKTKLLMLNSPSNPTGSVYTKEELKAIAEVLKKHPQIFVMSDDIYNKLYFSGALAPQILEVAPELKERLIIINGASKSYSMTGWRVGWGVGPLPIIKAMANYQSQSTGCGNSIAQRATFKAITEGGKELSAVQRKLIERKNYAIAEVKKVKDVSVYNPDGAFYLWVNISKCLGKQFRGESVKTSKEFCAMLLEDKKVITVPGVEFGMDGYLRLSFAIEAKRMTEAFTRMNSFISELK